MEDSGGLPWQKKSPKASAAATKRNATRQKADPMQPPDEEIEAAVDLLLSGLPPADFDPVTLQYCIPVLTEMKKEAAASGDYLTAEKCVTLAKRARTASKSTAKVMRALEKSQEVHEKRASAQVKLDDAKVLWDEAARDFDQITRAKMMQLEAMQQEELDVFDENVPTELPAKYRKHSVEYGALRLKEQKLLRNEQYGKADEVRKRADDLERIEMDQQVLKFQKDTTTEREALMAKHKKQRDALALSLEGKRTQLERSRDTSLLGPEKRLEHYRKAAASGLKLPAHMVDPGAYDDPGDDGAVEMEEEDGGFPEEEEEGEPGGEALYPTEPPKPAKRQALSAREGSS